MGREGQGTHGEARAQPQTLSPTSTRGLSGLGEAGLAGHPWAQSQPDDGAGTGVGARGFLQLRSRGLGYVSSLEPLFSVTRGSRTNPARGGQSEALPGHAGRFCGTNVPAGARGPAQARVPSGLGGRAEAPGGLGCVTCAHTSPSLGTLGKVLVRAGDAVSDWDAAAGRRASGSPCAPASRPLVRTQRPSLDSAGLSTPRKTRAGPRETGRCSLLPTAATRWQSRSTGGSPGRAEAGRGRLQALQEKLGLPRPEASPVRVRDSAPCAEMGRPA